MKVIGIVPARYGSTRFPGKPLALIAGKPLIRHVVERCQQAKSLADVILATSGPHLNYFKEMRGEAVATVIGSVVLMVSATFMRQISQPRLDDQDDSAEPGALPNGGPATPSGNSGGTKGPPSVS